MISIRVLSRQLSAAFALMAVALSAACSAGGHDSAVTNQDAESNISGMEVMSLESAEDVVSFSDHVAMVSVESETEIRPELSYDVPEGFVSRTVEISVERILYSYPGAPELPVSFEMETLGSFVDSDGTVEDFVGDGARLEVDGTYVMTLRQERSGGWIVVTEGSILAVGADEELASRADEAVWRAVDGMSIAEFASLLASTSRHAALEGISYADATSRQEVVDAEELPTNDTVVSTTVLSDGAIQYQADTSGGGG